MYSDEDDDDDDVARSFVFEVVAPPKFSPASGGAGRKGAAMRRPAAVSGRKQVHGGARRVY
jgi:hypothetical protein